MLKKIYELIYDHTMSVLFIWLLGTWCLLEMVFKRKEKLYTKEEAKAAEKNFKAPICPECLNYLDSTDEKE